MATEMKRFTLTVKPETVLYLDEIKQKAFYNKPYSEMYRHILDEGIKVMRLGIEQQKDVKNATS